MANAVVITVVGNLTGDPELRFTANGTACAVLNVAFNPRWYDKTTAAWKDGDPSFHRVTVWRELAENVAESLHKGDRVVVSGTLSQRHWEQDGEKKSAWGVTADAVGPDLSYAQAAVRKMQRTRAGEAPPDDEWSSATRERPAGDGPAPW